MQLSQFFIASKYGVVSLGLVCILATSGFTSEAGDQDAVAVPAEEDPSAESPDLEAIRAQIISASTAALTQGKGRLIVQDSRLNDIAGWIAARAGSTGVARSDVRMRLWQEGIRDYDFVPVAARGAEQEVMPAIQTALMESAVDWSRYNTIGVAVRNHEKGISVALVATRRVLMFAGRADPRNQGYLGSGYEGVKLYATDPAGGIEQRKASLNDGLWTFDLSSPGEGTWVFEIVGEGHLGPEILALWPRRGGASGQKAGPFGRKGASVDVPKGTAADAASWVLGGSPGPDRSPTESDAASAEDHLWRLIQATRAARGLPALGRLQGVISAARIHAADIGRGDSFGHHTSSGSAIDRLASQGVVASRVVENVGHASDVAAIHAALLASPAHRANILDPEAEVGGVGVVLQRDARGRWSAIASELFVELLPNAETREEELAIDVNRIRKDEGLLELKVSSILSREARTAAEAIAGSGGLALSASSQDTLVENTRFHYLTLGRVGIDVLVTNDRHAGADIHHVHGRTYDEVGVGSARLSQRVGAHPPGTLVTVFVFVER